jgi:hypothetical protein
MRQRILASDHEFPEDDILPFLPEGWIHATCHVLYGEIVEESGELDADYVRSFLDALPFGALANLDLETLHGINWMADAVAGKGDAIRVYRSGMELCRAHRPDVLASWYGVGSQDFVLDDLRGSGNQYWNRAHDDQKLAARYSWMRQRAIGDLQKWWSPTAYDKYAGVDPSEPAWTRASVLSCKLENDGKLILPFTWSQRDAVQLTTSEWRSCQVDPALEAGAHGVVLWEAWNKTNNVPNRRERVKEFVAALPPQVPSEAPPPEP